MPTYEYLCEACKKEFTLVLSISEHEQAEVTCPECLSGQTKQIVSTFITKTSKKS